MHYVKIKSGKRGLAVRLYLMLLDGRRRRLGEFWEYLVAAINPATAARTTVRRQKGGADMAMHDPNNAVAEGQQVMIKACLSHMDSNGLMVVERPEAKPRGDNSTPYYDARDVYVQLTPLGMRRIMDGSNGVWSKMISELYLGLMQDKLLVSIEYIGGYGQTEEDQGQEQLEVS